jgi:hypothetical protein
VPSLKVRRILDVVLSVVALAILSRCIVDVIPPKDYTISNMMHLKRRVMLYAQAHNELPKSIRALPPMEGYDNSILDGWKREIIFEVSKEGVVTFRSLGRVGVVGGVGEDSEIVRSFAARDKQGKWNDEFIHWEGREDTLGE